MRQYNADPLHTKKVKFYGFDNNSFDFNISPRAVKVTLEYLQKVDPVQAVTFEKALAVLSNPLTSSSNFAGLPREKKKAVAAEVSSILNLLDEHKQDYVNEQSTVEWAIVKQHVRILQQIIEGSLVPADSVYVWLAKRDSTMADNIRWILDHEGPGAKMVVWAHNGHIANDTFEGKYKYMGQHLKTRYGSEMVAFGFAFNQGSFLAHKLPWPSEKGAHSFTVQPAPENSLDATLAAAGLNIAVINFKALPKDGSVTQWFSEGQLTQNIGLPFSEKVSAVFI